MRSARTCLLCAVTLLTAAAHALAAEPNMPVARVTLEQAISLALARNPSVSQLEVEITRADALVVQARAASYPQLALNATVTRLDDERVRGTLVVQRATSLSANLQLSMPLFAPARWVTWRRARDQAALARLNTDEMRRQIIGAVARAYVTVLAQRRLIDVQERARNNAAAHVDFAAGRFARGAGSRLDLLRARQAAAVIDTQRESLRLGLARAREALGVLLGEEGEVDLPEDTLVAWPKAEATEVQGAASLRRRKDIAVAERKLAYLKRSLQDDWTDYAPALTAIAQPFHQNPATLTQPEWGWAAYLVLGVPLYDGGARYGAATERRALLRQAEIALEGLERQVRSEVRVATQALERSRATLGAARESARIAREALQLADKAWRAGATTNFEVLDAEVRLRDAETVVSQAEDSVRQSEVELKLALGVWPRGPAH